MLKNYRMLETGVVKQIEAKPFTYDEAYVSDRYGKTYNTLSYARLGYILGVLDEKPKTVLDVGYGAGTFLEVCRDSGISSFGFDISNYDVPDGVIRVTDLLEDSYDLVTFFDSLEHFSCIDFLSDLKAKFICVSVPSCNYPTDDEWFANWKHRRPDEHLWHFSPKALTECLKTYGFEEINQSCIEDGIRLDERYKPNIITGVYKKV